MDTTLSRQRWLQLGLGLIAMMAISSPQYVWTLFTKPLIATTGSTLPQIQWTFTILIVLQTFFSPVQGYLIDRFSPKLMIALGAALSGLGWVLAARVDTLLGRLCDLRPVLRPRHRHRLCRHRRPDGEVVSRPARLRRRRGRGRLRHGRDAEHLPDQRHARRSGYRHTLTVFGIVLGVIGALAALGLRAPRAGEVLPAPAVNLSTCVHDTAPEGDAADAAVLADVRHDDDDVDGRPDGGGQLRLLRPRFRRGRRHHLRLRRPALRADLRPHHQRPDPAVLRLGLGQDRPREHDGHRLRGGGGGDRAAAGLPRERLRLRAALRRGVLRLGRDLLAVPVDPHRHVRHQARHDELRLPLHGPGHRLAVRRSDRGLDLRRAGLLAAGLRDHHHPRRADRDPRLLRAEADASALARRKHRTGASWASPPWPDGRRSARAPATRTGQPVRVSL